MKREREKTSPTSDMCDLAASRVKFQRGACERVVDGIASLGDPADLGARFGTDGTDLGRYGPGRTQGQGAGNWGGSSTRLQVHAQGFHRHVQLA